MGSVRTLKRWCCSATKAIVVLALHALVPGAAHGAPQDEFGDKFMVIGTGPVGGAFRPIGDSLCDVVNEERPTSLVRCVTVGTAGSTFNLHAVANGAIQLGIAQEDLVAQMYADRKSAKGQRLRIIALLHTSPIAVMVHKASGITELRQIAGKNMNLGNRGSGQFAITAAILRAMGLRNEDLGSVSYLATSEFDKAFCDRKVDVVVEAVAHPSPLFEKLRACGGEFIDIPADVMKRMFAENRLLSAMTIAAGTYEGQTNPVSTLGMRNVLFTNAALDEEAVFRLTTTLRRRYIELRSVQPLLGSMVHMDKADVTTMPAPLHPGAARALELSAQSIAVTQP